MRHRIGYRRSAARNAGSGHVVREDVQSHLDRAPNDATPRSGAESSPRHAPTAHSPRLPQMPLGHVVATRGALTALALAGMRAGGISVHDLVSRYARRHASGDWGALDASDWAANERAVVTDGRVLSAYWLTTGVWLWVITEADRSATTFLLPSEY